MSNELTKEIDFGLAKIMVLCNIINRKTEMCCFVDDSGHIEKLTIRLFDKKQNYTGTPVSFETSYQVSEEYTFYVDGIERLNEINRCVEFLENTLKSKSIQYDMLHQVKEYVTIAYEI